MSWKAVEMQVVLPRVQDAAKLQELIAQRNPTLQHFVTRQQQEIDRKKRKTVQKHEHISKTPMEQERHSRTAQNQEANHPFLGKKIDYSG